MIDLTTQTVGYQSNSVSPLAIVVGGIVTATQIVDATRGEWFPVLQAASSGTLYTDLVQQCQKCFIGHNDPSQTLSNASVFVANGILVAGAGTISLISTSAADNSTYCGVFWSDVAVVLTPVTVALNGTTLSTGATPVNQIFRGELQNSTTGAHYDPIGIVTVYVNGVVCGYFLPGVGWVTSEINIALVSTTSDTGESSTAATPQSLPTGISTFYPAFLVPNALPVRNDPTNADLAPAQYQGVWGQMTLQPGMEAMSNVKVLLGLQGITS